MKSQCLWYALDKWNKEGGYIMFRKSDHWCMPHVLHLSKDNVLTHYVPPDKLKYPWHSIFGFKGHVKTEDTSIAENISPICMFFGTLALFLFGGIWLIHRTINK